MTWRFTTFKELISYDIETSLIEFFGEIRQIVSAGHGVAANSIKK